MTASEKYFEYLQGRSRVGWLYRHFWLYPKLSRCLAGKTLDVGCGIGDFVSHHPGTVGVDINPVTVEWCRRKGLDVHLMSPDVLPFQDVSFDGAILDNVLEHLAEPAELLGEIRRVLRPHGTLIIGVPGKRGYATDPDHKMFYDEATLVSTLSAAGFVVRRIFHMPWRSVWLDVRMRQYCLYGIFERV